MGESHGQVPSGLPTSKEDIMAMLQGFKVHVDAGGGLGKNEFGEDFIEIQEELLDNSDTVDHHHQGKHLDHVQGTTTNDNDSLEEEEEEEEEQFDEKEFEQLMREMELVDEDATIKTSMTVSRNFEDMKQQPHRIGLKRGFLLSDKNSSCSSLPSKILSMHGERRGDEIHSQQSGSLAEKAFTGTIVERDMTEYDNDINNLRLDKVIRDDNGIVRDVTTLPVERQQHGVISKFKQRMMQRSQQNYV